MGAQAKSTHQVADALSRKEVASYMGSLSRVVADFTEQVRQKAPQDSKYQKLVEQVKDGTTRQYWLENGCFTSHEGSYMCLQAN